MLMNDPDALGHLLSWQVHAGYWEIMDLVRHFRVFLVNPSPVLSARKLPSLK